MIQKRETCNSVNLWQGLTGKVWMSKNEKHFSTQLNIPVCDLLQVLTEANIEMCFEN